MRGTVPYRALLERLAEIIKPQLVEIRRTFPEYTPHDWDWHIVSLFDIAEQLFGADALLSLNLVDRFILTAGIYGHDWGMAVAVDEQKAIAEGGKQPTEGISNQLLPNEAQRLAAFARERRFKPEPDGSYPILLDDSLPHWPEYVRQTHAWRSGERLSRFLQSRDVDEALCDAGRMVCEGHWLDFEKLRDAHQFRPLRMVGIIRAHARLVALLVRLTDLFDIGRDRTPYALRRLIGPADVTSVKEWDKHEALDRIDCLEISPERRQVIVRGTCHKPALWPALLDLKRYLEDQLRQATGLLAEEFRSQTMEPKAPDDLGNPAHFYRLDSTLRWEVQAHGFKPVDVRFEFDRMAVFRILAKEIYGNEPHVFVRELLQNAIDAIRQLCARLEQTQDRRRPKPSEFLIHFRVERDAEGRIKVACRDQGIGMNEHIVTQYLARIGASYYTADEFVHDKVPMDAISRFGIGLLSCFMVAEKLFIRTKRLAKFGGDDAGIAIEIPSIDRHFILYPMDEPEWEGTEVFVEVLPDKLAALVGKDGTAPDFSVARYLRRIAGFVEVPIYVEDGDTRLLILHPEADSSKRPPGVPDDVEVCQLQGAYRWPEELQRFVMCPLPAVLSDYRVDVAKDLGLVDIDGFVSFPMPCRLGGDMRITNNGLSQGDNMAVQNEAGESEPNVYAKSLAPNVDYSFLSTASGSEKKKLPRELIYQDGIYVSGLEEIGQRIGDDPFPAHAWLNYRSMARSELTASRFSFTRDPTDPPGWVVIKARTYAFNKELRQALALPPAMRLRKLVHLEKFLGVSNGSVVKRVPWDEYPLLVLQPSGQFACIAAKDVLENGFCIVPQGLQNSTIARSALDAFQGKPSSKCAGYRGGNWLLEFPIHHHTDSLLDQSVVMLQYAYLEQVLHPVGLRFVTLPKPLDRPQPQELRIPRLLTKPENVRPLMEKILADSKYFTEEEWGRLRSGNVVDGGSIFTRRSFEFPEPFCEYFSHGFDYFNLRHPTVQWLVRLAAASALQNGAMGDHNSAAGIVHAALHFIAWDIKQADPCYESFANYWPLIIASAKRLPMIGDFPIPPCPTFEEFIPRSIVATKREAFEQKQTIRPLEFRTDQPWGFNLTALRTPS